MTAALEIEQIADGPLGAARFRLFVLDFDDLVVHGKDRGVNPAGYTEDELSRSLVDERGMPERDARLLIAEAKARFIAQH